jgi:hypothetical protein
VDERHARRSDVEREIEARLDDVGSIGRPLSRRARQSQRSLEAYLKAGNVPRWMARLRDIDRGIAAERRRLEQAYRALREEHADDHEAFAQRWRDVARSWRFEPLNQLIRQHNEWYPIERDLPMDLRTRDYVLVNGRNYRRPVLGPAWVLEQFPSSPPDAG